ncbi:hypothetical protein ARALYDRAFT_909349 [Arabidopsis lyrata subsp. lyrata]|uniref:Major facilitator superfamily (MFS) profile domain-containing protein n=1 Tax=Arabidopsis lyrata subsp. lyrata TaxID=81972 RepID=D7M5Y2_ARALL|nr:hypothetical protein ARALYDRAFT_909349 [Arabidopsis lyrata subsp. lyrata]
MAEEYNKTLLENKTYHDGCSGCNVEQMKQRRLGYPYMELSFVWIVVLSTSCSFMLGRALTSVSWGIVSDRYGRKPIIIVGTVSIVNFWMAIAMRFLLGSFNCLLGTMKMEGQKQHQHHKKQCDPEESHHHHVVEILSAEARLVLVLKKTCGEAPCGFSDAKTISRDAAERLASVRKL